MGRTHVVLTDEVVDEIDRRVGERGRSRFLEQAAREKLDRLALEEAMGKTSGLLRDKDYPDFADQDAVNEWVRRGRRSESGR